MVEWWWWLIVAWAVGSFCSVPLCIIVMMAIWPESDPCEDD
jgi:hypothetical protein